MFFNYNKKSFPSSYPLSSPLNINHLFSFLTVKIDVFSGEVREGRRKVHLSNEVNLNVGSAVW